LSTHLRLESATNNKTGRNDPVSKKTGLHFFRSPSLWLLFFLVVSGFLVNQQNFLTLVPQNRLSAALLTKSSINFKMKEWKTSPPKADAVILGSSLPMCCLYYADDPKNQGVLTRMKACNQNPLQAYTAAEYLQKKVSKSKGTDFKVFNATVAASMISDVYLLTSKLMDKPPKSIILGVGLRDFADNINCSFAGTPTYQALFDLPYALKDDNALFTFCNATNSVRQELASYLLLPMYRNHLEIGLTLNILTEKIFQKNGERTIADAKSGADTNKVTVKLPLLIQEADKKPVLDSLGYEKRYMPANYKQMDFEAEALDRLCKLCKKNKTELILINMPVSSGHQALCSKEMRARYLQVLETTSTKNGIKYLNFENNKLIPDSDFLDTVHMGPTGAVKFLDYLVSQSGIFNN